MNSSLLTALKLKVFCNFECMKFIANHAHSDITLFAQVLISSSAKGASSRHVALIYV
jgi:hypothetical protein